MTATYITIGLGAWGIVGLFAMAFIRGADERRQDSRKRETEWRRA
jgi:hypothetical protein